MNVSLDLASRLRRVWNWLMREPMPKVPKRSQPEVAESHALSVLEKGQRAVFLKRLVERARKGDQQAFLGLYQNHSRRIYNMSLRLAESLSEAENLTRDIFVEAFHNLDAIGDEQEFSTWLYRRAAREIVHLGGPFI